MDSNPIMELVPIDVCMLCGQKTAVLSSHCITQFMKYMTTTFFDNKKTVLDRFQEVTAEKSFCALCAQKVVVSHKFKDIYEEISKKRTSFKKSRVACFVCECKSGDLVQTKDNPNDLDIKIKSFMGSTLYPRPYLQCAICLDCLFYLNVWFEMNLYVMEKVNGDEQISTSPEERLKSTGETPKKIKLSLVNRTPNTSNDNDGVAFRKNKENITPPENNQKRFQSESEALIDASPQRRKRNSLVNSTINGTTINEKNKKMLNKPAEKKGENAEAPQNLHMFLKQALKHLKSIRESDNTVEWPENTVKDKKMFDSIPYVLMINHNKQNTSEETENYLCESTPKKGVKLKLKSVEKSEETTRRSSSRLNKPIETIELSDTDSEKNKGNESTEELTANTSSSSVKKVRTKSPFQRTRKIKFKMSSSIFRKSKSLSKYICNVCDVEFKANCDYKAHCLWHVKPDNIIINVTRQHLPSQTKASEFNTPQPPQDGKMAIIDSKIDEILEKYVSVADAELNNSKEIENIDDSNSREKEELNSDNEQEKNEEIHVEEDQNKHKDSTNKNDVVEQQESENEAVPLIENKNNESEVDSVEKNSDTNTSKESDVEESDNDGKENENSEPIVDTENNSDSEHDSENSNQTETLEKNDDVTAEIDNVQPEKESPGTDKEQQDDEESSTESNFENTENDDEESVIEKQLARLHGEESLDNDNDELSDSSNEKEQNHEEETQESSEELIESIDKRITNYNTIINGTTNNHCEIDEIRDDSSETDQVENEKEENSSKLSSLKEDSEISNKTMNKKRKRSGNLVIIDDAQEESGSDVETVTPRTKRVRFAMDYQSPNSVNEDTVPDIIFDEEEKDDDNVNKTEVTLQEIEDNVKVG